MFCFFFFRSDQIVVSVQTSRAGSDRLTGQYWITVGRFSMSDLDCLTPAGESRCAQSAPRCFPHREVYSLGSQQENLPPTGVVRLFLLTCSRYCSSLCAVQCVCIASNPPPLLSLFSLTPSFPASLTSLSSPHEILQYASKLTDTHRVRGRILCLIFPPLLHLIFLRAFLLMQQSPVLLLGCELHPAHYCSSPSSSSLFSTMILRNGQSGFLLLRSELSETSSSSPSSPCRLHRLTLKTNTKRIRMLTKTT
ncbi:hypothetical protein CHARACLAT_016503 [Characodon lateralis]|uniref:Uncharacterized protein n=1 Tax=Characodon lateralis TaxID=208331 RepID=A0ABU7CQX0_9TELE|nr:hypothetical protein [Characodon lateralis]